MRREVGVGNVDVRRFHRKSHLAAFIDVLDYIVGAACHRGQQSRHELDRVMGLQECGVVCQQRVSCGVRLVKSIAGKLRHQVENLFDFLRRKTALGGSSHESLPLLRHFFGLFFAHGPAQQIGFAE